MQSIAAHSVVVTAVDTLETVEAGDAEVQAVAEAEGVTPIP